MPDAEKDAFSPSHIRGGSPGFVIVRFAQVTRL